MNAVGKPVVCSGSLIPASGSLLSKNDSLFAFGEFPVPEAGNSPETY